MNERDSEAVAAQLAARGYAVAASERGAGEDSEDTLTLRKARSSPARLQMLITGWFSPCEITKLKRSRVVSAPAAA